MRLINLKSVSYQKEFIRSGELVRYAPFEFYEKGKKINNIFVRLSIIFMPIAFIVLVFGLPINFLIKGKWGYDRLSWYSKWVSAVGI